MLEFLRTRAKRRARMAVIDRKAARMAGNNTPAVVDAFRRVHMILAKGPKG